MKGNLQLIKKVKNQTEEKTQKAWEDYLSKIKIAHSKSESEEYQKNVFNGFLHDCFGYDVNTQNRQDSVIYDNFGIAQVIIEFKALQNKTEMSSFENLNCKALQELIWYYLQETMENKSIKHLIISNGLEFLIWEGSDFEEIIDKKLRQEFVDFANKTSIYKKTDQFYKNISLPFIERNLTKFKEKVLSFDYNYEFAPQVFGTEILLKKVPENINSLNREFYNELLYILGLEEQLLDGVIKIVRAKNQQEGSLLENVLLYAPSFDDGFELVVTWINRLLFLKLLEGQILDYNDQKKEYAFLTTDKIPKYGSLKKLFFDVLAKPEDVRNVILSRGFELVPYLNSSLFVETKLENQYGLQNLDDDLQITIYPQTVLKDHLGNKKIGKIRGLNYLLEFLEAYNFGSVKNQDENSKLINSSVLGSFFEKLNGYKDGSFYTPSSITEFMSATSIEKLILDKFEQKNIVASSIKELRTEIKLAIKEKEITKLEAVQIIDKLKIVDPAVGSGYFLVSCLNQLLYFKSRLGLLLDKNGEILDCELELENDELKFYKDGKEYQYYPNLPNNAIIQESLFEQKQKIIENCLFGVDINPNSVKICQLRLWIELLKNTYYKQDHKLQTLPNIDINIKCGNSLLSRFEITQDIGEILKNEELKNYKQLFADYQNSTSKENSRQIEAQITSIKTGFRKHLNEFHPLKEELQKQLSGLFAVNKKKVQELENAIEELENNPIYQNAFEWRFEFPQVLAQNGDFVGFDLVIGNPPYIQLQKNDGYLSKMFENKNWDTFVKSGDIYALFYEQSGNLIAKNGYSSLITSNKWLRAGYGESLRKYILNKTKLVELYDLGSGVFESATVDTNILLFQKTNEAKNTSICSYKKDKLAPQTLKKYWQDNAIEIDPLEVFDITGKGGWFLGSPAEFALKQKIEQNGKPLKDWDIKINYGIKTGLNEAFIIDTTKRNELIAQDPKSAEIIKPILRGRDIKRYGYKWADLWVINSHNGYKTSPSDNLEIRNSPCSSSINLESSPSFEGVPRSGGVVKTTRDTKAFMSLPFNPKLKEKAKELRKAGVLSEVIFWNMVKNKQLLGLDFDRQKIIDNYIVDFYCANLGLVVEIDGESHDHKGIYDQEREQFLQNLGLEIVHFEDIRLKKDAINVGDELFDLCKNKLENSPREEYPQSGGGVLKTFNNNESLGESQKLPHQQVGTPSKKGNLATEVSPIDINDYPAIKKHLDQFEPALSKRSDKGKTPYNLRHCAYFEEFQKEKVVWGNISYNSQFCFVDSGVFVNAPANMMTSETISIKYLIGIMNSKIFNYDFKSKGIFLGNAFEWKKSYVEQVNLPLLDTPKKQEIAKKIEVLVEEILPMKANSPSVEGVPSQDGGVVLKSLGQKTTSLNKLGTPQEENLVNTQHLEAQIDQLVYQLYDLTEQEIGVIEG